MSTIYHTSAQIFNNYQSRRHTTRTNSVRKRVHFLFAVLMCEIVSLLRFVISTVIQLSDVHSSHIYLAVLFPHNCYPIYSLTL